jgi:Lrp/AsnC family transcriptional regulator, regulator for asnA, asnC and gidA
VSSLDEIDTEIIRILCKDARTPFKRIGKMLGVGTDTVFRRFKKLQAEGIISGSTVILSSKACGIEGLCGLFIKLKSGSSLSKIKDKLTKSSQLTVAYPTWGEYDFYVDVYYRDFQEVTDLIASLREIKEVAAIDSMIYALQEWSIPFILSFEAEVPPWLFDTLK